MNMALANIKLPSKQLKELQKYTGEQTGQKAVNKALLYFIKEARQRRIGRLLQSISFKKGFNPLALRRHER